MFSSSMAFDKDEGRRRLRPSAKNVEKKKPSCRLAIGGRPRLILPGGGRRRSKLIITDQFRVVPWRKQPYIIQYGARSRVLPGSGRSAYQSAGGPVHTA
ncbi:hypothetical protein BHE74_00015122 [Ensete ventricosum]|nr:hypothetical protein BHE74_00015122 [Ensete ventricosum]